VEPDVPASQALLSARGISRGFGEGPSRLEIFSGVSLDLLPGDLLSIVGPSGSGKSTLLHLFAGLDDPDAGEVRVEGIPWSSLSAEERARRRGASIGFVFQFHHLLPELTAEENVALPLLLAGAGEGEARRSARECLDRVDLLPRSGSHPRTLSGGERQRVAIARAVIRRPRILLCDEPTGSLDPAHAAAVFEILTSVARERAGAAVIVTHDRGWAARCATMKTLTANGLIAMGEGRTPESAGGGAGPELAAGSSGN
jgi:lipoprotein-releasing system ATP-binding protein